MPIYEYACPDCNARFETYARTFTEQPACPDCGGAHAARQLSTFAVSSTGGRTAGTPSYGGCGEGPPCGAAHCGRLAN